MMTLKNFVKKAIEAGVENDLTDVWVKVEGITCTVDIESVLDHAENFPFEASEVLEADPDHDAWEKLYEQFLAEAEEDKEGAAMLSKEEFVSIALAEDGGVQNDILDLWVVVQGEQYTVRVDEVLGRPEKEPFESSYTLEEDLSHPAWDELYEQYVEHMAE